MCCGVHGTLVLSPCLRVGVAGWGPSSKEARVEGRGAGVQGPTREVSNHLGRGARGGKEALEAAHEEAPYFGRVPLYHCTYSAGCTTHSSSSSTSNHCSQLRCSLEWDFWSQEGRNQSAGPGLVRL